MFLTLEKLWSLSLLLSSPWLTPDARRTTVTPARHNALCSVHDGLSLTMGQVRARSIRKVFQQPEKFDHQ